MNMKIALVVLLAIALAFCDLIVEPSQKYMADEFGRKRVFHGVNAVYKVAPFHPIYDHFHPNSSLCDEDFQNLKNWGINVVRLYVAWEGVMPQRNTYSKEYVEHLRNIVRKAANYGVQVLLDAHQDLYNRKFCGEGFPDWAIASDKSFPMPVAKSIPKDEKGYPIIKECLKRLFGVYYMAFDVGKSFQDLYENKNGLADEFANMWKFVVSNLKDEPNVIGKNFHFLL